MRIKVYSYVTSGYDNFKQDGRKYIDLPKTLTNRYNSTRMIARLPKCLPHLLFDLRNYDACLWIDSNISFRKEYNFKMLYYEYFANVEHCGVFAHTIRSTINEEIEVVNKSKKDYPSLSALHQDGIGRLAWTGILYRKFTPEIIAANNRWWSEITTKSSRDQLSFPYCFEGLVEYIENPDIETGKGCWKKNSRWYVLPHLKNTNI